MNKEKKEVDPAYMLSANLVARLKIGKLVFGLREAKKAKLVFILDVYYPLVKAFVEGQKELKNKIRLFDLKSLQKVKPVVNRGHVLNVIGVL